MLIHDNKVLECMHLDPAYMALTVQNLMTVSESFNLLDIHKDQLLNDLQVKLWMKHNTDLQQKEVVEIFQLIDIYASGFFDVEMFYFFTSIMISAKDHVEKDFINRHSRSIYNLFETRAKGRMTLDQFRKVGWLFGFQESTVKFFYKEFDISKDKKILPEEFKLYAVICIELQCMLDGYDRISAFQDYRRRLIWTLKDKLIAYVKHNSEPRPSKLIKTLKYTQKPYIRRGRGVRRLNIYQRLAKSIKRRWKMMRGGTGTMDTSNTTNREAKKMKHAKNKDQDNFPCCIACNRRQTNEVKDKGKKNKNKGEDDTTSSMPEWIKILDEQANMKHPPSSPLPSSSYNDNDKKVEEKVKVTKKEVQAEPLFEKDLHVKDG